MYCPVKLVEKCQCCQQEVALPYAEGASNLLFISKSLLRLNLYLFCFNDLIPTTFSPFTKEFLFVNNPIPYWS